MPNVTYNLIDDRGLHINWAKKDMVLDVDNIVICAGQNSLRDLYTGLVNAGIKSHLIGGAYESAELDAKRAIKQAADLAVAM